MEKNIVQTLGDNLFSTFKNFSKTNDGSYECIYDGIVVSLVYDSNDSESDVPGNFEENDPIKSSAIWRVIIYVDETKELLASGSEIHNIDLLTNNYSAVYNSIEYGLNLAIDKLNDIDVDIDEFMKYIKGIDNPILGNYLTNI